MPRSDGFLLRLRQAPQVLAQVALAPPQEVVTRLEQFGLDLLHPFIVARVAIVLTHAPERGTGFQHIAAEVLDEPVVMLLIQKVHQRPARFFVPTHGIHELDDG